jgi:hypothetical protein
MKSGKTWKIGKTNRTNVEKVEKKGRINVEKAGKKSGINVGGRHAADFVRLNLKDIGRMAASHIKFPTRGFL